MMRLDIINLRKAFGGLVAVDDVSFSVVAGEILGLVGPNGSGKSTTLNLMSGVDRPDSGSVTLNMQSLVGQRPSMVARAGLARTFQNLQIYSGLTVQQNVEVGADAQFKSGFFSTIFGTRRARSEQFLISERAGQLLEEVGLGKYSARYPSELSYGQRRLMEIARARASAPKILMLDEPCAGLSQTESNILADYLRRVAVSGVAIIVIEHNMRFVMNLVDRMVVLNFGRKIAEGAPADIRKNDSVIAAYLGKSSHAYH